jgi:hypothetical protein
MKVFVKWTILFKTELNVDDDGTAHLTIIWSNLLLLQVMYVAKLNDDDMQIVFDYTSKDVELSDPSKTH